MRIGGRTHPPILGRLVGDHLAGTSGKAVEPTIDDVAGANRDARERAIVIAVNGRKRGVLKHLNGPITGRTSGPDGEPVLALKFIEGAGH